MRKDNYEGADFYDCENDLEEYSRGSEEEALRSYFDTLDVPDEDLADWCLDNEVTVYSFRHREWSPTSRTAMADEILELLENHLSDNFLNNEEAFLSDWESRQTIHNAIQKLKVNIWEVEECDSRTFEGEELLGKVRAIYPGLVD